MTQSPELAPPEQDQPEPAQPPYAGFETLDELQQRHLELMRAAREARTGGAWQPASVMPFLKRARATGARLSAIQERELAQAMLDFWVTELGASALGSEGGFSGLSLAPFDERALPDLGEQSPFKGLSPYTEADAETFFGRESATIALAEMVLSRPITIVSGASGSGKSSLIFAGLLPRLKKSGEIGETGALAAFQILSPGGDPFAEAIDLVVAPEAPDAERRQARQGFLNDPASFGRKIAAKLGKPPLLIVDQFEEVFTQSTSEPARIAFARAITSLPVTSRLIIGIRSDFLAKLSGLPGLKAAAEDPKSRFVPAALPPADIRRVILATADRAGVRLADGVCDALVKAIAGEPAGLPLLQFTLDQMWREARRSGTHWISARVAEKVGSPREALQRAAEAVFDALALEENKRTAEQVFLDLVTPALEQEFVRQPRTRAELHKGRDPEKVDRVLEAFTSAGLLRVEGDGGADDWFDVMHEALIRNWKRLGDWLEKSRKINQKYIRFEEMARLWDEHDREPSYLISGDALIEGRAFKDRSPILDELIAASEQGEAARKRQSRNNKIILFIVLAVLLGGYVWNLIAKSRQESEFNRQLAAEKEEQLNEKAKQATELLIRIQDIKARARAALDAIGDEKIDPLKDLLRELGDAQTSELSRITLRPSVRRTPAGNPEERTTGAQVVATQKAVVPSARIGTCEGWLWFGSQEAPKVTPFPTAERVSPRDPFTLTTSIRLRDRAPPEPPAEYIMGPQVGVVPSGATVRTLGEVAVRERPSGRQFWAKIETEQQYCTSVYVQYQGSPGKLDEIKRVLSDFGVQIPRPELLVSAGKRADVRYFYPEDAPVARELASRLAPFNGGKALALRPLLDFPTKPSRRTIEVWIDLGS